MLKIELPTLLGIYPPKYKNTNLRRHVQPDVNSSIFSIGQITEAAWCPWTEEWVKETQSMYTTGYDSAVREGEILLSATTWMDWRLRC